MGLSGLEAGYGLKDREIVVQFPAGLRSLNILKNAQAVPGTHLTLCVMYPRIHLPGVKAAHP